MSKLYKSALIGCGKMGTSEFDHLVNVFPKGWLPLSHGITMEKTQNIDLVALCDPNEDALKKASQQFSIEKTYTSYEQCLNDNDIDIVSIATRTPPRPNIIRTAIKSGVKAIHFEKPICQTLGESKSLINELNNAKIKYSYGTLRRYMAAYRHAKSMIDNGIIGTVKNVSIENDVTTLMWNHPHSADMLVYFSGSNRPLTVQANCTGLIDATSHIIENDLTLHHAEITFDNGVRGTISSAPGMNTRIYGDKGILTIGSDGAYITHNSMKNDFYIDQPQNVKFSVNKSAMEYCFQNLVDQIDNGAPPLINGQDIIASQEILFGCAYSSQKKGAIINVADLSDEYTLLGKSGDFYA
jgi:predicted dehydrogenase